MPEYLGLLDPLSHGSRAAELTDDGAFLQAMVDSELALTLSLVDAGLAPEWMTDVCAGIADASRLDLAAVATGGRAGGNPVIPLVHALGSRAESIRDGASDHLHVGATSQDIVDTATMLVARRVVDELLARLGELADRFAELADRHRDTIMVGRTLGQHAAPTTFGFVAAGWLAAALQAGERLDAVRRALPVQLGGAVGTLAVISAIARARRPDSEAADTAGDVISGVARRLDLAEPPLTWHTDRAVVADLASALSLAAGVAGNFALEVTVLSRTEAGELGERLASGDGGSSAMPHKRNPVTAVLVTAAARQAPGLLSTLHSSLLAEDQRPSGAWQAEWLPLRALESIAITAVTGAADLASRLVVDEERMRANLDLTRGLVFSESATTILGEVLGKSAAFELVGAASRSASESRTPLRDALATQLASLRPGPETAALRTRIDDAFDPDSSDLPLASVGIDRMLARYRERVPTDSPERMPKS